MAALAGAGHADYPDQWGWTIEAAPSLFAPRMHGLDNALVYEGLNVLDRAWVAAGTSNGQKVPTGFAKIEWGVGGRIAISREFNEDLRGGILVGFNGVWKSDRRPAIVDTSSYTIGTTTYTSTTTYSLEESVSLPFVTIGVFLHKVFRYEDEPALRTYIGGWGAYGGLVGASISGTFRRLSDGVGRSFSTDLTAEGWSAGGLGGVEYAIRPNLAVFGETGFEWCVIPKVQWLGDQGGGGRLATSDNKPVSLDFSGFYLKIGVKVALSGGGQESD